jgi:hypothetical protein
VNIIYPIEWDERDNFERPAKGWLSDVIVQTSEGLQFNLCFYDPVRLAQEIEDELAGGKAGFIEFGLIVVPEVTKMNIEKAIKQAENEGYFKSAKL